MFCRKKGGTTQRKIHGKGLKLYQTDKHSFHFYARAPHPGCSHTVKVCLSNILSARGHQILSNIFDTDCPITFSQRYLMHHMYTIKYVWWPRALGMFDKESLTVWEHLKAMKQLYNPKHRCFRPLGRPKYASHKIVVYWVYMYMHVSPTSPYSILIKLCSILEEGIPHNLYAPNFLNLQY